MEIYFLAFFCVLITSTASFSALDAVAEHESLTLDAQNRNCKCENGKCVTDKQGNSKCVCKPGFALQDDTTCKPCDCGSLGKCIFILKLTGSKSSDKPEYEKKCICNTGSAPKDGVCVECFCGENSACDFDYGDKRCYCLSGYSEKDGVCTRCDCGFNGQCEYDNGKKKCDCDEGFLELNGICEECDCGDHGTCSFQNGQKTCKCQTGFSVKEGKCEQCDCGSNSNSCQFMNGVKQCSCKDRYADRYGTCEECYCGTNSRKCMFEDNQKKCDCLDDYVQKGETCKLACSGKNQCHNGGYCKDGFCFCQKGTNGEFCDVIEGCSTLCPTNQTNIKCSYNVTSQNAYCRCLDNNLKYDWENRQCRRTCDSDDECVRGFCRKLSIFDKFCDCFPPSRGDRCELVDCSSGVIKCKVGGTLEDRYPMHLLWWGGDTLFFFDGQDLVRFQREKGDLSKAFKYCDLGAESSIHCQHNYLNHIIYKKGSDRLCIPWKQLLYLNFRRHEPGVVQQTKGEIIGA